MQDRYHAPSVVVGVDTSLAARDAAVWAIDEAVGRDIPLRLISVVDAADAQLGAARTALHDTRRLVESTGDPAKIETEIRWGTPLGELRTLSRSAALICIGSLGSKHARERDGSVAAALAASAHCPVAVVRHSRSPLSGEAGSIVADVQSADPDAVLRCAFEEARLRESPLRVVTRCRAEVRRERRDRNCPAHAQLDRQIAHWIRRYPDVLVQTVAAHGTVSAYLAGNASSIQLVVTAADGPARSGRHGYSVLTVRANHL